ncbi:MAG: LdpA C-terminal domain-containing domain [Candidatus Omnitrophica bacterium]|nr:LdpA C-terminal domain-containing domain [Candidatus Omnitrophota bacterium]
MNLTAILKNKRCFKLVCGAGNEDAVEVEKLVAVYAKAGANYFDLSAREDIVRAAKRGLERVIPKGKPTNYFFNVSVGIAGDPHVRKALITGQKCKACGLCQKVCQQKAILPEGNKYAVIKTRCIGCGACAEVCPVAAISFTTENKDLNLVLPPLVKLGLDSLELHAVTDDEETAYAQWLAMNKIFPGILSLCLDRSHLGDKQLIARIKRFIGSRNDFTTIIQADGAPMSGGDDRCNTTLQALATADIVNKAKLPVWLLISGGTNSKTAKLSRLFEINAQGVAIGSFARKIIRKYIDRSDFLENKKVFNQACKIAKQLVDKSLKYL